MSETTNIGWTDHTGGPWLSCTEISPGCANCYARELMLKRLAPIVRKAYLLAGLADWETRPVWGKTAPRMLTKGFWTEAVRLNRRAEPAACGDGGSATGDLPTPRPRMFPSLIDVWDDMPAGIMDQDGNWLDVDGVRARFFDMIRTTPHLDWLLLTKRPEQVRSALIAACESAWTQHCDSKAGGNSELCLWLEGWLDGRPPRNVWLGFSAENKDCLWKRWGYAKVVPAVQHFVSCEPLLEDLSVTLETVLIEARTMGVKLWPIIGGESGAARRDCGVAAIVNAARVCRAQDVPVYVKQDCAFHSEQQGRIPDDVWAWKQFPGRL